MVKVRALFNLGKSLPILLVGLRVVIMGGHLVRQKLKRLLILNGLHLIQFEVSLKAMTMVIW